MPTNFSLQNSLAEAFSQVLDPFTTARIRHQQTQESANLQTPVAQLPPMAAQFNFLPEQQHSGPTLSQIQQPTQQLDFRALARQAGLNLQGLSRNPEIGRMQILQRLGPGFTNSQLFSQLMQAFSQFAQENGAEARALIASGERTLQALLGRPL